MWVAIRQALIPAQFKVLAGRSSRCVLYSPRSNRGVCVCVCGFCMCVHVLGCLCVVFCELVHVYFSVFVYVLLCVSMYVCVSVYVKGRAEGEEGG